MKTPMRDIDERTNLAGNSMFELLLFRLGEAPGTDRRELFGINVFKVREILVMPEITVMANAPPAIMGVSGRPESPYWKVTRCKGRPSRSAAC